MFTAHLILSDLAVYVSVQETKPSRSIRATTNRIPIETKQGCSPFQRIHGHREAVPLAMLISRVTTLVAARSLVVVVAPLAVAGTKPVRAW
jgi:hypothetical protein